MTWRDEDLVIGKLYKTGEKFTFSHVEYLGLDYYAGETTHKFRRIPPQPNSISRAAFYGGRGIPLDDLLAPREPAPVDEPAPASAPDTTPTTKLAAPNDYGQHEALHTASIFTEMVETHLMMHPVIAANPTWNALAEQAHEALFNLYQAIGAVHLGGDDVDG